MRRSTAPDLYRYRLSAQYQHGQRVWDGGYAHSKDPDVYEKIRLNTILDGAIDRALTAVAGKAWTWEPGGDAEIDKRAARWMTALTSKIRRMAEALKNLAEARFTASSFAFVKGAFSYDCIGENVARRWWIPRWLQHIDRRRIQAVAIDQGDEYGVEWHLYSVKRRQMEKIERKEWFIRHVLVDQESTLGYGRGEIDSLYQFKYVFDEVLEEGLAAVARLARGTLVVKIDNSRSASPTNPGNTLAEDALEAIEKLSAKYGVVFDKSDDVNLLESSGSGHKMVTDFLDWLVKWMVIRIEGSYLPTGGGGEGGAYGLGKEQANTREGLVLSFQRAALEDTVTADLGGLLWRLNMPTLLEMDRQFAVAQQPRFTVSREKVEDAEKASRVISTLRAARIPLKKSEVYQKTEFTAPSAEDFANGDVLEDLPPPDPFGFGAGGGGAPKSMDDLDRMLGATPTDETEPRGAQASARRPRTTKPRGARRRK